MAPRCVWIDQIGDLPAGGKARGLARLRTLGLPVPEAFVVVGASLGRLPTDLLQHYARLGEGKVAVRSSAGDEDGSQASFAGQYCTVLDVQGQEDLKRAIERCLASTGDISVRSYRGARTGAEPATMSVVVQRMVQAQSAGVLFTVDPVLGRRDCVVIDAVRGLGDALVSGRATPDHHVLPRQGGPALRQRLAGERPVLSLAQLDDLRRQALDAECEAGGPLDMEWAFDAGGKLAWLQARPVTSLPADPNALDDPSPAPARVYTRCNIGEMMPGAVSPLTFSVTARGIDHGLQAMHVRLGVQPTLVSRNRFVGMFFGQLFLDLSTIAEMTPLLAGSTPERICQALCGRSVEQLDPGPPASALLRARGGLRYARYLLSAGSHEGKLRRLVASFRIPTGSDAGRSFEAIDAALPRLLDAYDHHMTSSSLSGALASTLLELVSRESPPSEVEHARVAGLLSGASGVESADIASGVDRLVETIAAQGAPLLRDFAGWSSPQALRWLRDPGSPAEVRRGFRAYLRRHGHRAVRELEIRQPEWAQDPLPLVLAIQTACRGYRPDTPRRAQRPAPGRTSPGLALLVRVAHGAVRRREATKSLLVKMTARFKVAYRALAGQLERDGALPDPDLIFFLTHQELGQLCSSSGQGWARLAEQRRTALPRQMALQFPDVSVGRPEPAPSVMAPDSVGRVVGQPVSGGVARGPARVVRSLDQALQVQPGEILIAPITDAGWTPCFGVIAGLVTDVGSAVSHGAVVAREYGLPCVVNASGATRCFETGAWVEVDANRGVVARIPEPRRASPGPEAQPDPPSALPRVGPRGSSRSQRR